VIVEAALSVVLLVKPGNVTAADVSATVTHAWPEIGWEEWRFETDQSFLVLEALGVEAVEPNYLWETAIAPNDSGWPNQWNMLRVGADSAWEYFTDADGAWFGRPVVHLGIVDTGIDPNHREVPFLAGLSGGDWWIEPADPSRVSDPSNHGTHVAGIACAPGNNGLDVAGVMWGGCELRSYRFLGGCGFGLTSDALSAIEAASSDGTPILNNSWSGGSFSQAMYDAIAAYNGLFVAAAGNNARDVDSAPRYPCAYDLENVLCVASTDASDGLSSFSNWGIVSVDLAAPGTSITSWAASGSDCKKPAAGTMSVKSGTSMAAPMVAGAASLLLYEDSSLGWRELKRVLIDTVEPLDSLDGMILSGGLLRIDLAVEEVIRGGASRGRRGPPVRRN
jgi:subtilisin family serine protease